jgi:hypothetical protein
MRIPLVNTRGHGIGRTTVFYVQLQPCMVGERGGEKSSSTVGCVSRSGLWVGSVVV